MSQTGVKKEKKKNEKKPAYTIKQPLIQQNKSSIQTTKASN